jgi:hypothetical protein
MQVSPVRIVRPASARPQAAVARAPQPAPQPGAAIKAAKARGADPLPTFGSARDYQNYVINLVGQSRTAEGDLDAAKKAFQEGKGSKTELSAARERLDAIKLQLMVLRDSYPIPSKWSRSKLLGGEGFDKETFWKRQVEAIPGKEVIVTPPAPKAQPAPQPAKPQAPAAQPAAPVTPAAPADPMGKLLLQTAGEGLKATYTYEGFRYQSAKLEAIRLVTKDSTDERSRRIDAIAKGTLEAKYGTEDAYFYAYKAAFSGIQDLLAPGEAWDQKARKSVDALASGGLKATYTYPGFRYQHAELQAVRMHTQGRSEPDLAFADKLATRTLEAKYDTDDAYFYAFQAAFSGIQAVLGKDGSLEDRKVKAAKALVSDGLKATFTYEGFRYQGAKLSAIVLLADGSSDDRLKMALSFARKTLDAKYDTNEAFYYAYQSAFNTIKAALG